MPENNDEGDQRRRRQDTSAVELRTIAPREKGMTLDAIAKSAECSHARARHACWTHGIPYHGPPFDWSEEEDERMFALKGEGLTAAQIAKVLGRHSGDAVLKRVQRLKAKAKEGLRSE